MNSSYETVVGVLEEFATDIVEVVWSAFELLGLAPIVVQVRREFSGLKNRRKSIVRIVGSLLSLKPVPRPYLRIVALRSLSASSESVFSANTQSLVNGQWLSDHCEPVDIGQSNLVLRRSKTDPVLTTTCEDAEDNLLNNSVSFGAYSDVGLRCSLYSPHGPHHSTYMSLQHSNFAASSPFTDPSALAKISALEDELSELRLQISQIMTRVAKPTSTSSPTPAVKIPIPPQLPSLPIPPPPPPIPVGFGMPRLPLPLSINQSKGFSFEELLRRNKETLASNHAEVGNPNISTPGKSSQMCMSDVLKGLTTVKLKQVARSPGGTPIREAPLTSSTDPGAFLAAALRKRFAKLHMDSPENDTEDDDNVDPFASPGNDLERERHVPKVSQKYAKGKVAPRCLAPILKKHYMKPLSETDKSEILPVQFGQHLLRKSSNTFMDDMKGSSGTVSPSSDVSDASR